MISLFSNSNSSTLKAGDTLPSFVLNDQDGHEFNSQHYIGKKKLIIYFYPKDESPVCTKEACAFRDSYTDFTNAGALVIGINSGSVESHKAFQLRHSLPFTLLSDPNNEVLKLFGVKSKFFITGRETFLIDLSGKVVFTFQAMMSGNEHSDKALEFLKTSQV